MSGFNIGCLWFGVRSVSEAIWHLLRAVFIKMLQGTEKSRMCSTMTVAMSLWEALSVPRSRTDMNICGQCPSVSVIMVDACESSRSDF